MNVKYYQINKDFLRVNEAFLKKVYKLKNSALKKKLKEKVLLLEKNSMEFDNFKIERDRIILKIMKNHELILEEKNKILEELMRKNHFLSTR